MNVANREDRLIEMLMTHHAAIVNDIFQHMSHDIPGYAQLPTAPLLVQNRHTLDAVIQTLKEHDPAIAGRYVEALTEQRLREGVAITAFLLAIDIVNRVLQDWIARMFPDDPSYRDQAIWRIDKLLGLARNVSSRRNLANVMRNSDTPSSS